MDLIKKLKSNKNITQGDLIRKNYVSHTKKKARPKGMLDEIMDVVCEVTNINKEAISGKSRKRELSVCRQLFCYFAKRDTANTLELMGNYINRHHSTVLWGIEQTKNLLTSDRTIQNYVHEINKRL